MKSNDKVLVDRALLDQALRALVNADLMYGHWTPITQAAIRTALEQQCSNLKQPSGEVVVTTNQQGQCVAVTRQDDEGKILSVIWQAK